MTTSVMTLQARISELETQVKELRKRADFDGLTGCLRREAFMDLLNKRREFGLLPRRMTVAVADVDFFKKVNDTHGHDAGDIVLKEIAQTLQDEAPHGSLVCRMGGEEFVILIPDALPNAMEALEKVRKTIASTVIIADKKMLQVTASFGAAAWDSETRLHDAIKVADEQLYLAKNSGRNRIAA